MAQRHIYCDKTELVLMVLGKKKVKTINLSYDQIMRIQFDKCTERKFLVIRVPSEKITITSSKHAQPFVYTMQNEKNFFTNIRWSLKSLQRITGLPFQITFNI